MKYAVAVMDIKPAEFWDLTLAEFNVAMEAYMWKKDQQRVMNAEQVLWVLSPYIDMEEAPSPEQLAGLEPKEEKEKKVTTKDDIEEMKRRMGK